MDPVRQALEPPGISGTPFFKSRPGPRPSPGGKRQLLVLGAQALGPGVEDERTDCCHCRWVLGHGASLHWGSPRGPALPCPQPPSPIPTSITGHGHSRRGAPGGLAGGLWPSLPLTFSLAPHACTLAQAWHTVLSTQLAFLGGHCLGLQPLPSTEPALSPLPPLPGQAMDPHEMVVKNPYAHISIPRAHLRPDLRQQLEVAPSSSESQPLPVGSCPLQNPRLLQPMMEAPGPKGAKGAKGAAPVKGQQAWPKPGNPYGSGRRPAGLTYTGLPPIGRGDDIAHHCCCCPCCSCCHCPPFCRCHSCCCVVS